jgi:large subunit ribosomal protein L24
MKLKKGDQVYVTTGKEKKKFGKIVRVFPKEQKVLVQGINMVKRHTRANPGKGVKGGVTPKEAPIPIGKVMFLCPQCQKPTRLGYTTLQDGRKHRVCKKSGDILD